MEVKEWSRNGKSVSRKSTDVEADIKIDLFEFWHIARVPFLGLVILLFLASRWMFRVRTASTRKQKLGSNVSKQESNILERVATPNQQESDPILPLIEKSSTAKGKQTPKRVTGSKSGRKKSPGTTREEGTGSIKIQPVIFFSSLTGSTEVHAKEFEKQLEIRASNSVLTPHIHDLSYIDYDEYFVSTPKAPTGIKYCYLILVPTYNIDTILDNFILHLQETHHDFRIDTAPLSGIIGYSVFGFGDREGWPNEEEGFCSQAKEIDKWMAKLTGRRRLFPLGMGDVKSDAITRLLEWTGGIVDTVAQISVTGDLGEGVIGSGDAVESDGEELNVVKSTLGDLEDIGGSKSVPIATDFTTTNSDILKPMVPKNSPTYTSLTKQGYSIIGSHSGVKICRWTKSALRGRGSCYKRSFYGIASHLCMETTPSLSCSNKCVFCWRHGTNPVGTTWRWQVDPPEMIFEGAKEAHLKKIKTLRGVPGVRAERFQEAMRIRHCALSLVGEPIFYPYINEFLSLLHNERISSFLVCNAQHPDQLAALKKVTQLYVSIDASNKESLRKIDRPLHRDFWERFVRCLDIIRSRRHNMRTVYRLTLVKGFNIDDEVAGYADLIARGLPCFVEIKGVTYCGTSTSAGAGLSMSNVPFYHEVQAFVTALDTELHDRGLDYGIAAEHAHSCCALMASSTFQRDGKWCTIIDYDRFFELLESGKDFGPEDYMGECTPEWALWGNGGFDPADQRVDRKGRAIEM